MTGRDSIGFQKKKKKKDIKILVSELISLCLILLINLNDLTYKIFKLA